MGDLVNNLIPFWVENYFKDEQYLMIDGKPVLYIYNMKEIINFWGSEEIFRQSEKFLPIVIIFRIIEYRKCLSLDHMNLSMMLVYRCIPAIQK